MKSHAVQSQTTAHATNTYCCQLQANLSFWGRRTLCLWEKCGRRKTRSRHEQDTDTAGEQHDVHFTDVTLRTVAWLKHMEMEVLANEPFKWLL